MHRSRKLDWAAALGSPAPPPSWLLQGLWSGGPFRELHTRLGLWGLLLSQGWFPRSSDGLSGEAAPDQAPVSLLSAPKLYASCDLGRKWLLLHEQVTKDHVFW